MIALDDNGNFAVDANNLLEAAPAPNVQNGKSECRCMQGEWFINPFFGLDAVVWSISQSSDDRALDIKRVVSKYTAVLAVSYDPAKERYNLMVTNA